MSKNTPGHWVTGISAIAPRDIYIRGFPMQSLLGRLPFSAIAYLILRGRVPTPAEARMMDVIFSSILDYGLQKSGTIAARAVVSVNPQMTAGLSAGMLGAGEFAVSPEHAGRFILESYTGYKESGLAMQDEAAALVARLRAEKKRVPGFGHQVFRGVDPRAQTLRNFAVETGVWGEVNEWYGAVHEAFRAATGKHDLVMNDIGMLAGIMIQMGFTPPEMTGLALLSTFPGLIAHVSEELQSGVVNRIIPNENADYDRSIHDTDAALAAAGWN